MSLLLGAHGSEVLNQKLRSEKLPRKCFRTRVRFSPSPPSYPQSWRRLLPGLFMSMLREDILYYFNTSPNHQYIRFTAHTAFIIISVFPILSTTRFKKRGTSHSMLFQCDMPLYYLVMFWLSAIPFIFVKSFQKIL